MFALEITKLSAYVMPIKLLFIIIYFNKYICTNERIWTAPEKYRSDDIRRTESTKKTINKD